MNAAASRDDWFGFAAIAAVAVGTVAIAHLAPGAKPESAESEPEAACVEWTDGCIVCRRIAGEPTCSMPGIACVRGAARCLAR